VSYEDADPGLLHSHKRPKTLKPDKSETSPKPVKYKPLFPERMEQEKGGFAG